MKDYEILWHVLKNSIAILQHQGNTPITPAVLNMMCDQWEKNDDLRQINEDMQAKINELGSQPSLPEV